MLEAVSLGLGSVWLCAAPLNDRMTKAEAVLGNPDGLHVFAVVPVGYSAETRKQKDRFDESRIHYL